MACLAGLVGLALIGCSQATHHAHHPRRMLVATLLALVLGVAWIPSEETWIVRGTWLMTHAEDDLEDFAIFGPRISLLDMGDVHLTS